MGDGDTCVCVCVCLKGKTHTLTHVTRYAAFNPKTTTTRKHQLLCDAPTHAYTYTFTILAHSFGFYLYRSVNESVCILFSLFILNTIALSAYSACHLFAFFAVAMFGHHPLAPTICDVFLTRFHFFVYVFRTFPLPVVYVDYTDDISALLKHNFIIYLQ